VAVTSDRPRLVLGLAFLQRVRWRTSCAPRDRWRRSERVCSSGSQHPPPTPPWSSSHAVRTIPAAASARCRRPFPTAGRARRGTARLSARNARGRSPPPTHGVGEHFRQPLECEEALLAATRGGACALQRDDVGRLAPGAGANAAILGCPSYTHLVYRSGVPLIDTTVIGGRLTWRGGEAPYSDRPMSARASARSG
jgi:hypothetical protein